MNPLCIDTAFPRLRNDMAIARAQMQATGAMPPCQGLDPALVVEMKMCYVQFLIAQQRLVKAETLIQSIVAGDTDGDTAAEGFSLLYQAWLWLAQMSLYIEQENESLALSAAERSLQHLSEIKGKKSEDFLAILASLLYSLAQVHNAMGDNSRATKELTKAHRLLERLAKRDDKRFSALLLDAVEASTAIIRSRNKQMSVLAHYQASSELYENQLHSGDANATRQAMENLIDTLGKEGDIMLEMGNSRNAVRYYTRALRYQKKLGDTLGHRELNLSIGLASALMRLVNRRAAAEQLLHSLQPLAQRLNATAELARIDDLLNSKSRNFNIMNLLKGIF